MLKALAVLTLILLSFLPPPGAGAAGYQDGLAPPAPPGGFPAPSRKVAGIVTDTWRAEHSTNRGLGNSPRQVDVTDEAPI